ncbi:MAG: response regulator transcription factor, partial [Gemmatimonadota bacterium]|nr:response regulator transcription factor [Gemmatimonadota bacterium]
PTRGGAAGAAGLTARETEIVQLAAEGRSNKAIARALDISPRTVSTHVANLYRKLGVASRMQLADFARRTGITTSE